MNDLSAPGSQPSEADDRGERSVSREPDALYQNGRLVARVADIETDLDAREVRFGEIYHSDTLVIPEECDFQDYRVLIQRIAFATKIQKGEEHKGRVLRGVSCDILGSREK